MTPGGPLASGIRTSGSGATTKEAISDAPEPDARVEALGDRRAEDAAERADPERDADRPRAEAELLGRVEDQERPDRGAEDVEGGGAEQRRPQQRRAADEAGAVGEGAGLGVDRRLGHLGAAHVEGGGEEAEAVDGDRDRRGEDGDEEAAERLAADDRDRAATDQQRVRLDVVDRPDQRGEDGLFGDHEEDAERAEGEGDDVEERHRQHPEGGGDGDAEEQHGAAEVGDDHERAAAAAAVGPGAEVDREEEIGRHLDRRQEPHLLGVGVEREDGEQRHREEGDLVAEERDRLPLPVIAEGTVGPQQTGEATAHQSSPTPSSSGKPSWM